MADLDVLVVGDLELGHLVVDLRLHRRAHLLPQLGHRHPLNFREVGLGLRPLVNAHRLGQGLYGEPAWVEKLLEVSLSGVRVRPQVWLKVGVDGIL